MESAPPSTLLRRLGDLKAVQELESWMETLTAKLLRIHGRVHGVGYRESMRREAERLGLSGWVRNRRDGTVEALVCGSTEQVEQMVAWAGRGPPSAMVQRVIVADTAAAAIGTFQILFTQ